MDHSDIIISVIVVLCIAAGVTAYGLTNPNNVFSDLAGFTPSSDTVDTSSSGDNGVQLPDSSNTNNNPSGSSDTSKQTNDKSSTDSGSHQSKTDTNKNNNQKGTSSSSSNTGKNSGSSSSNSGSSSGSSSSGSGGNSGNSGNSGTNTNNGGSSSGGHPTANPAGSNISNITKQEAINIANKHVEEPGAYAASAVWDNHTWYVYIHDSKGDLVDTILIDWNGTVIGRG